MPTFPTEASGIEAMARRVRIFELPLKEHASGHFGQRGENLARARDELMELECQECAGSLAPSIRLRQADTGQERLKIASASFDFYAAIL
jgi:hypothetical protein